MTPDDLVSRAAGLAVGGRRAVLGVAGSPGSGKTTLVTALAAALGPIAVHVPMDGFHLADVELARLGRAGRKGAADTFDAGGYLALLRRLRADTEDVVYAPAFERHLEQPIAGSIAIPRAARLILTEGNYLLLDEPGWRGVRAELDEAWYCAADGPLRLARLVARHVASGKTPAAAAAWVAAVDEPNAAVIERTLRPRGPGRARGGAGPPRLRAVTGNELRRLWHTGFAGTRAATRTGPARDGGMGP